MFVEPRLRTRGERAAADAGLATVASALNANDQGLARIAAVHLRIPDLPDQAARDAMEAADILIKSADWNPALHPRAGTPPNPRLVRANGRRRQRIILNTNGAKRRSDASLGCLAKR
jgi:hypothetical protein